MSVNFSSPRLGSSAFWHVSVQAVEEVVRFVPFLGKGVASAMAMCNTSCFLKIWLEKTEKTALLVLHETLNNLQIDWPQIPSNLKELFWKFQDLTVSIYRPTFSLICLLRWSSPFFLWTSNILWFSTINEIMRVANKRLILIGKSGVLYQSHGQITLTKPKKTWFTLFKKIYLILMFCQTEPEKYEQEARSIERFYLSFHPMD